MEFKKVVEKMQQNFSEITKDVDILFEVEIDKDEFWNLYLNSFPEGTNNIYRKRREYDCSCCRNFLVNIGKAIIIRDGEVKTIFDFDTENNAFNIVFEKLDEYIKSRPISSKYVTFEKNVGVKQNFEKAENKIIEYNHFHFKLPNKFIEEKTKSVGEIQGSFRDLRNVFKRSLDEISVDSVDTVLELISQGSLYRGEEWKNNLQVFRQYKTAYDNLSECEKELFAWENINSAGVVVGKIRNHSIGTLLLNISEDMDLDLAVKKYEDIVAPINYKRPKTIYTKKMLGEAKEKLSELGYLDSLKRRYATIDDINVNDVLFVNKDSAKMKTDDIFAEMEEDLPINPKKFSRIEEIGIDKFIEDVLPTSKEIEILFENKLTKNLVSIIAPEVADSKTMFKWDNSYSWSYTGNIADSMLKENVKTAGGKVNGDLRFSIQWNDGNQWNKNDLDAHCKEPDCEIYYAHKKSLSGELDVDIMNPEENVPAVENIIYLDRNKMKKGKYDFYVEVFTYRGGTDGFRAEIEFDNQLYEFNCEHIKTRERVATVTLEEDNSFSIKTYIKPSSSVKSRTVWNLSTNKFVPVSMILLSPNYWGNNKSGNKHYMFMLKNCVNDEKPNGFYNEFLKDKVVTHKRMLEALGSKMKVENSDNQLSGLGFSSTIRNEVILKVKGKTERILKVKF